MATTYLKPISIPEGISLVNKDRKLTFSGKLGEMSLDVHEDVDIKQEEDFISFSPNKDTQESVAITGTMRALTNNYIQGVEEGFEKKLEINGVGYRAVLEGQTINLSLGFSHPVKHDLPEGVTADLPSNTEIILKSMDKQLVGQVAAEIRDYRPPEPYKGKGVKYADERIIRKESKKA
ncbi:MAG: 50S ribosomal protein L6 [Gammaproteobacteria bacterium]|jgi:large subunit ribosomal protein L6|nr:50S ribosomal protein L6 [Gammaproteobacteria bacterium]HJM59276.1 50S ribosomal protein L6 [SAR86 cluster bacterium]|tara:strand:+ start:23817 stop:24350 length:534 start_codon:yes stop_codon:yes gene_type:complete